MSNKSVSQPKKSLRISVSKKETKSVGNPKKRAREEPVESEPQDDDEEEEEEEADASSSDDGSESESESEPESESDADEAQSDDNDDNDIPMPQKKQKKSKKEETEKFSNAMNALLDTHLKAYDRKDPILARSKKELKHFEDEKLEQKAKRLLLAEKKKRLTANRNRDLLPTDDSSARSILQHEKSLKKTAQRGVIKLFNAILMTQTGTQADLNSETGVLGQSKKKELVNEISKEKFLDLVQQVGK